MLNLYLIYQSFDRIISVTRNELIKILKFDFDNIVIIFKSIELIELIF